MPNSDEFMQQQPDLRAALENADKAGSYSLPTGRSIVEQLDRGTMIVQRLPINRVDIKVEVAAFIDHHFINRTSNDGTVLQLSKERLTEELTNLFHSLETRASDIDNTTFRRQPQKKSAKKQNDENIEE